MSRYYSYINSTKEIIDRYNGNEPLSSFLKKYFATNKKFGSKDRKVISHLCYCYFRLGKAALSLTIDERILTGLFLCSNEANEILASLKPEWNSKCEMSLNKKLLIINYSVVIAEVFPWKEELSKGIEHEKFCESFFIQPDLFIRLRPGKENVVKRKLQNSGIVFNQLNDFCLALPNTSKVDSIIKLNNEAVIQDYSSQYTGNFIKAEIQDQEREVKVWDCCAASGGKSIMAYDIAPNIDLIVSDVRESILLNLRKRFHAAGIKGYKYFVADLASLKSETRNQTSDIIICDVPCSGSGTWSRTPEQLYFFKASEIERYSTLQKKIVSNVIPQLKENGSFIYITCSVFRKENEEVVEFIKQNFPLHLQQMEVLKGYDKKADSMFVAVFRRS